MGLHDPSLFHGLQLLSQIEPESFADLFPLTFAELDPRVVVLIDVRLNRTSTKFAGSRGGVFLLSLIHI